MLGQLRAHNTALKNEEMRNKFELSHIRVEAELDSIQKSQIVSTIIRIFSHNHVSSTRLPLCFRQRLICKLQVLVWHC